MNQRRGGLNIKNKQGLIKISEENRGKFTAWCKSKGYGEVTNQCIQKGKNSKSPIIRKRATFAQSARSWH